MIGVFQSFC